MRVEKMYMKGVGDGEHDQNILYEIIKELIKILFLRKNTIITSFFFHRMGFKYFYCSPVVTQGTLWSRTMTVDVGLYA